MPNGYFQFKQFRIEQGDCAQRVSTDACLLGAADLADATHILNISTGTGLLALMATQRTLGAPPSLMNRFLSLFISVCLLNITRPAYGQSAPHFNVQLFSTSLKEKPVAYEPASPTLYEDEDYIVSAYCYGEFGGGLLFKSKRTDSTYTCQATCVLNILKLHQHYIANCTLAHMAGSARVLEIADPRKMKALPINRKKRGKHPRITVMQGELSTAGTKTLADSVGVHLAGSFLLNERPYFIVTNSENTFLTTIESGRFMTVTKLADFSTWSYDPSVRETPDGHYLFFYKNDKSQGYIDVYNTTINVIRYL